MVSFVPLSSIHCCHLQGLWSTVYEHINTSHGFSLPIHCILSNGYCFEIFKFERSPNPTFLRGNFPGDPEQFHYGLELPDLRRLSTTLPFIIELRRICEVVFDVMLSAYIVGLKAHYKQSEEKEKRQGSKRPRFNRPDRALQSAEDALEAFRTAEGQCKDGDLDGADETAKVALLSLRER